MTEILPPVLAPDLSPIALIAGKGGLPSLLLNVFRLQNRPFVVIALAGQTHEDLVTGTPHIWASFGEVGKIMTFFKANGIKDIVMAGGVDRPALSTLKPDWEGVKWIARLTRKALGDDGLLKGLIALMEEAGYRIVAPDHIINDLLAPEGILSTASPDDQAWRDIRRGLDILSALSPVDVGQAVVVQENLVLGIEAIEGTDGLVKRVKELARPGLGGVLVKVSKLAQEHRADLPTIGLETIRNVYASGLRGIAIEAGRTLWLDREETLSLANEKGLFIVALGQEQCHTHL